jgi:hypothetical protein
VGIVRSRFGSLMGYAIAFIGFVEKCDRILVISERVRSREFEYFLVGKKH